MNILSIPHHDEHHRSIDRCHLFTDITKKKHSQRDNQQKMICTADTLKGSDFTTNHHSINDFDYHFQNKLKQFKLIKAEQIAEIAFDGQIPIKNVIKRLHKKLQSQLFQYIESTINQLNIHQETSAERKGRSPKQLGSTIEHALTPRSIQTPGFEFESTENKINQFSIGSSDITLGNNIQSECRHDFKINKTNKCQTVSQFSVGARNPTSKKIKDKIMNNCRKNHI